MKSLRRLARDIWWSIWNKEFFIGLDFDVKRRPRKEGQGYNFTWYDGPLSSFWWGPLYINWMGDSFGQMEDK